MASGSASCSSRRRISARPVAQVVSTVKMIAATTSGNQPPSSTLVTFDAKKAPSTMANSPIVSSANQRFHLQTWKISTASIIVVMIIVPLTEMP